jgi:hypothetical protein
MTATLDMPKEIAIATLRKAGTGDNLLAVLDALISYETQDQVEETHEPIEWVNAVNLESEDENVVTDEVIDF